ncbi:MAG TPA: IPT/TIG domain-containing protein [Bryobacteraceae bacterium]|nr:IPT/TIG domain-containing protein [Bryobacteraceae bacterium]
MGAIALAVSFCVTHASGQLVTKTDAIPNRGKPPVVFLNGYQRECEGSSFRGSFGSVDQLLNEEGRVTLFFDNCAFPNHPAIETLGNEFAKFLRGLRYENGEPVARVDVVAHSMGGLIVRSYLAGKQTQEGVFTPPADTMLRKVVLLGTSHFGSPATNLLAGGGGDAQSAQLEPGSRFTFDLATWNQGTDDLRGVDTIAVLGNAANGLLLMRSGFGDGVTTLTSGSLDFTAPGRTRVVPYCHTGGITSFVCARGSAQLAQMDSRTHDSFRILLSFLNDTPEWRSIGTTPQTDPVLSKGGGVLVRYRDAADRPVTIERAVSPLVEVALLDKSLVFADYAPSAQPLPINLTLSDNRTASLSVPLLTGATRALNVKSGPSVNAIFPSAAALFPRSVAPGSLISVYGSVLTTASGTTEVLVAGQPRPQSFASAEQINTLVPEDASGLVKVQVKNSAGEHTVNLIIEPVVPALFAPALNALTGVVVSTQAPLRRGDHIALFATGLGRTETRGGLQWAAVQPQVWFGGQECTVTFAGRAPGFPGLDQINCQVAANALVSDESPVFVYSGGRTSNVTTLALR